MTDTATPGEHLDQLIGELRTKADNLRDALNEFGNEFRDDFASMIDELSVKVDEIQAEWDERRRTGLSEKIDEIQAERDAGG